jgi:hypothetical protein
MYNVTGDFLEPKVSQHGSNMVMTNVSKPTKQKFLNIDTTFSDDLTHNSETTTKPTFSFTIPEITDVKPSKSQTQKPYSFYSIAASLGSYLKMWIPQQRRTSDNRRRRNIHGGHINSQANGHSPTRRFIKYRQRQRTRGSHERNRHIHLTLRSTSTGQRQTPF